MCYWTNLTSEQKNGLALESDISDISVINEHLITEMKQGDTETTMIEV